MEQTPVIKIVKADDFKRFHANGFFGGLNPYGELVFHITEDTLEMPKEVELEPLKDNPEMLVEKPVKLANNTIRIDHAEVVLPIKVVPSVIQWLQRKLDEYNTHMQQQHDN